MVEEEERDVNFVVFPRTLLKNFILLYKEMPCLWDRKCAEYKQKRKRLEAITRLTEMVQKHDPTATRVHILRKIESLRACVRRENRRVQESWQKATCFEEVYKPNLWYFDMFSFLLGDDGVDYRSKKNFKDQNTSFAGEERTGSEEDTLLLEEKDNGQYEESLDDSQSDTYANICSVASAIVETTDSRHYVEEEPEVRASKRQRTEVDDEYDAIGINVAAKLRGLNSVQRILAEKLINDVLFQAQVNALQSSTMITTQEPFNSAKDPL